MRIIGPAPIIGKVSTAQIDDDAITEAKVANDAIGISELKAGIDGNIISFDASGDPVMIATGNDSQVLTSAGAGAQPAFEDAAAGPALSFVSTQVASSSSSIEFTGIDNSSEKWVIEVEGVSSSGDVVNMQMHTSNDTSSHSYDTGASDYNWALGGAYWSTCYCRYDASDDSILTGYDPFSQGSDATNSFSGQFIIHNPSNTTFHPMISFTTWYGSTHATPLAQMSYGLGKRNAAEAITAVKFSYTSGNIDEGRFSLYKLAHS